MRPGKDRAVDGDLDPDPDLRVHDRSQKNPLYTVREAKNASLGDNHGTIVQGAHSPEISTFAVRKSNIRDQFYIQGGNVGIYLTSDSKSPEMTLQRMGIAEALSHLVSTILGWGTPSDQKEGPPPSMADMNIEQGHIFYTGLRGNSDVSIEAPSTLSDSVLQDQAELDSGTEPRKVDAVSKTLIPPPSQFADAPVFSLLPLNELAL
ncbi:hypothetical protein D9611_009129 [Ephemerocybe angulata]|uniref:Uncharacterized protein n=1 Tax=Ephemerocybe angulata TaxID=980116 RepID=A0A8H5CFM3_9AGAR|nr:hypothetical protein D9611_009129 [Tulosesus angulatus]